MDDYEDNATEERTKVASSDMGDDCKSVMNTLSGERQKAVQAKYDKATMLTSSSDTMLSILQNLQASSLQGLVFKNVEGEKAEDQSDDEDEEHDVEKSESGSSTESEDAALQFARGTLHVGRAQGTQSKSSGSSKGKNASGNATSRKLSTGTTGNRSNSNTANTAGTSKTGQTAGQPARIAQLDGRTQALQTRIETLADGERVKLDDIEKTLTKGDWCANAFLTEDQDKQMQEDITSVRKNVAPVIAELKTAEKRLGSSAQGELLSDTKEKVTTEKVRAEAIEKLCKAISQKSCPSDQMVEAVDDAHHADVSVVPYVMGRYLRCMASEHAQYESYHELPKMMATDTELCTMFLNAGISEDGFAGFGWVVMEELGLKLLRGIPSKDLQKHASKSTSKSTCKKYFTELIEGSAACPRCLDSERLQMVVSGESIISCHTVSLKKLEAAVSHVNNAVIQDEDCPVPLLAFFHKDGGHASGQALKQLATDQIEARADEGKAQEKLESIKKLLKDSDSNPRALDLAEWQSFFNAMDDFKGDAKFYKIVKATATQVELAGEGRFTEYMTRKFTSHIKNAIHNTGQYLQSSGSLEEHQLTDASLATDFTDPLDFAKQAPKQMVDLKWMPNSSQQFAKASMDKLKHVSASIEAALRTTIAGLFLSF